MHIAQRLTSICISVYYRVYDYPFFINEELGYGIINLLTQLLPNNVILG